jgi:hypothetical protein
MWREFLPDAEIWFAESDGAQFCGIVDGSRPVADLQCHAECTYLSCCTPLHAAKCANNTQDKSDALGCAFMAPSALLQTLQHQEAAL